MVKQNRTANSFDLAENLGKKTNTYISPGHVRRVLCGMNLRRRTATKKLLLTSKNVKRRLEWCTRHKLLTVVDWRRVLFSDEITFQLFPNSQKNVRRFPSEKYHISCINPQPQYGGGKVTIWGGISWYGYTDLHIVTESINATRYVNILDSKMLPFMEEEMPLRGAIFQQDNARTTLQWFSDNKIDVLLWPACSPDLNIIENVWKMLGDRVAKRKPETVEELKDVLKEEWIALPIETLHKLFESIPRRINDCIASKGFCFKE